MEDKLRVIMNNSRYDKLEKITPYLTDIYSEAYIVIHLYELYVNKLSYGEIKLKLLEDNFRNKESKKYFYIALVDRYYFLAQESIYEYATAFFGIVIQNQYDNYYVYRKFNDEYSKTSDDYELNPFTNFDGYTLAENAYNIGSLHILDIIYKFYDIEKEWTFDVVNYDLSSIDDEVRTYMFSNDASIISIYIDDVTDPLSLINLGFMPNKNAYINTDGMKVENAIYLIKNDYSEKDQVFWIGKTSLDILTGVHHWKFLNRQHALNVSQQSSDSYYIVYTYPDLVYTHSKRPVNNMDMYRLPNSKSGILPKNMKYIRVTRYSLGMSRGGYYVNTSKKNFCGTFYYNEPESTTVLTYVNSIKGKNKYSIAKKLLKFYVEDEKDKYYYKLRDLMERNGYIYTKKYYSGKLNKDLRYKPNEIVKLMSSNKIAHKSNKRFYAAHLLKLYAMEDPYDQLICNIARSFGFDVIILEEMVGSYSIVTEVLDVRDRITSCSSLVYDIPI